MFPSALPAARHDDFRAWVSIAPGCDNACTFCIVPLVRGPQRSRSIGDILAEVQGLARPRRGRGHAPRPEREHVRPRPDGAGVLAAAPVRGAPAAGRSGRRHPPRPVHVTASARLHAGRDRGHGGDTVGLRAHPLPAAVGFGPRAQGDAALLSARTLPGLAGADPGGDPRIAVSTDVIVGFPGETEEDFARDARRGRARAVRHRVHVPVLAATRHAGAGLPSRSRRRSSRSASTGCGAPGADLAGRVAGAGRAHRSRSLSRARGSAARRPRRARARTGSCTWPTSSSPERSYARITDGGGAPSAGRSFPRRSRRGEGRGVGRAPPRARGTDRVRQDRGRARGRRVLDAEIVSVDSMLVYRGMDIGTAKPTAATRPVPHHLIDVAEPSEPFKVARFQREARAAIAGSRLEADGRCSSGARACTSGPSSTTGVPGDGPGRARSSRPGGGAGGRAHARRLRPSIPWRRKDRAGERAPDRAGAGGRGHHRTAVLDVRQAWERYPAERCAPPGSSAASVLIARSGARVDDDRGGLAGRGARARRARIRGMAHLHPGHRLR